MLQRYGLKALEARRKVAAVKFLYNVMHNLADVIDIVNMLNFRVHKTVSKTMIHSIYLNVDINMPKSVCCSLCGNNDLFFDKLGNILKQISGNYYHRCLLHCHVILIT